MKMINGLVATIVIAIALPMYGHDFEHKKQLNRISKTNNIGRSHVKVLKIEKGEGRKKVKDKALRLLKRMGVTDDREKKEQLLYNEFDSMSGGGWQMIVNNEGEKISYINMKLFGEAKKRKNSKKRGAIPPERLAKLGRKFIDENLEEFIQLGEKERLEPFHSFEELDGDMDEKNNKREAVVGNQIVFTRVIDDITVVGPGSKISVMFANDETPVAFRLDWPRIKLEKQKKIVENARIEKRIKRIAEMNGYKKTIKKNRYECGYYDPGAEQRWGDYIQPACYVFYEGENNEYNEVMNYTSVVPLAEPEDIELDYDWDEAFVFGVTKFMIEDEWTQPWI